MFPPINLKEALVPISPDEASMWVGKTHLNLMLYIALATVVLYDTICTFDKEVKYFWGGPLSLIRVVFFLNRYGGIFGVLVNISWNIANVPLIACNLAIWGSSSSYWVTIIMIDYALMVRVLALWQNNRVLSVSLSLLLVAESIIKFASFIPVIESEKVALFGLGKHLTYCGEQGLPKPSLIVMDWAIPLAYGVLLLTLALWKATVHWRQAGLRGPQLVSVLIRDQLLYFFLAISCSSINIIRDQIDTEVVFNGILDTLGSPSLLCILGSRIFFNLKEAGEHGVNSGTNWSSYSYSASASQSICFGDPLAQVVSSESQVPMEETQQTDLPTWFIAHP